MSLVNPYWATIVMFAGVCMHADIDVQMYMTAIFKLIINHQPFHVYVQVSNGQGYKVTLLSLK